MFDLKVETKLIILCGLLWLLTKTVLLYLVPLETGIIAGTLLNLFFIMLIAVYSIHRRTRTAVHSSFLEDIRAVLRNTARYVLLAVGLYVAFMFGIARSVTDAHQLSIENEIISQYSDDEMYAEYLQERPELEGIDREKAMEESLSSFRLYASWYVQATLALMALMIFAIFASLISTAFWRNLMS